MEDTEMLDLFNGQDLKQDPIKKVTAKNTDKYVKALSSAPNISSYSSPDFPNAFEGGLKVGSENAFETTQKEEADAQSFGTQLGKTSANIAANIVTGTIGGIGFLGTLFEDSKTDYSNAITDWSDRVRNPFGELKRKNNDVADMTDSGFWLNSGQSLVESAIQFGLIAETGGLAAGAVASKLGKLLSLGNKSMNLVRKGVQGITAVELSYLEGAMSGAVVYRDIYKNQYDKLIDKGISVDKANELAKKYASDGASSTVKLNTTINTALNLTGIGSVFKSQSTDALQYFTKGLGKRVANEDIKAYTSRLVAQSPEMLESFTKQNYGRLLSEMTQEGLEEVVTQLAENTGKKQGEEGKPSSYLGMFKDAYDNLNTVVNSEGVLNFALGAVGGAAQTVLLENIVPSQRVNTLSDTGKLIPKLDDNGQVVTKKGKVQYEQTLVSPKQRDIYDNQRYYTELKDALVSDLTFIDDTQTKIKNSKDKTEQEELRRKLFAVNTLDSVFKGVGVNLIESYNKILNVDNQQDLGLPFTEQKKEIVSQIDAINSSVPDINNLTDEDKAKLIELKKALIETSKQELKNKGKTQATTLGLSKDINDNDYKRRAVQAVDEIKQVEHFYDINKDKYNSPEETNANYAEYVTKLQADILGRNRILNDLTNDFVKQKADFQLFSSIEDFSEIEKLLFDGKLASLLEENKMIEDKVKNHTSTKELQEIVDTLDDKVYSDVEIYDKIKEKVKNNEEQISKIEADLRETEDFKKSNIPNINKYLQSRIDKYTDFKFLMDYKKRLTTFERNTEAIKTRIKKVTSTEGRNRFITDVNERIIAIKKQVEEQYSEYSYEEARKMNEDDYYYTKVKNIDKDEREKIEKEIIRLQEEVDQLENDSNNAVQNKPSSYFSSLLSYLNKLSDIKYLVRLRKNRINELKEYLSMLAEIKSATNQAIAAGQTTSGKDGALAGGINQVGVVGNILDEDENLNGEAGDVELPSVDVINDKSVELKQYINTLFPAIGDFIFSQLELLDENFNELDVLNAILKKYNINKENRIALQKTKLIKVFVKILELGGRDKKRISATKKYLIKLFSQKPTTATSTTEPPIAEDENLNGEAGNVVLDEAALMAEQKNQKISEYVKKNFTTMADFVFEQLKLIQTSKGTYTVIDMLNATISKYNVKDPKKIDELKIRYSKLFVAINTIKGENQETINKRRDSVTAMFFPKKVDDNTNEEDENLNQESGNVVEIPVGNIVIQLKKYLVDEFSTMSDFIEKKLQELSVDYTVVDMFNTILIKYSVIEKNRVDLMKNKLINLFIKMNELNGATQEQVKKLKEELAKTFSDSNLAMLAEEAEGEEDETLDTEAGNVVLDEEAISAANELTAQAKEASRLKQEADAKALEQRELEKKEAQMLIDELDAYVNSKFGNISTGVISQLLSMYNSGNYDFKALIKSIEDKFALTPTQSYNLRTAVIGFEPYLIKLKNLEKKTITDIKKQLKKINDNNIPPAPVEKPLEPVNEVPAEVLATPLTQSYGVAKQEQIEKEEIIPFTLDMFRIQYGDVSKEDSKRAFNFKVGSKVTLQVDKDRLFAFQTPDALDVPISIILGGVSVGYLPTLSFIRSKYIKNGVNLTKNYFPANFKNTKIANEFKDIQRQIKKFGLSSSIITQQDSNGEIVYVVDFFQFNMEKITKIRELFKNQDTVVTTVIKKKSGGRAITSPLISDLSEFAKLDPTRIKIHVVSAKGLFPVVKDLLKSSFNYAQSNVLAVMSYPNAIGERNIYPITIDKLNENDVNAVKYLFNLFSLANTGDKTALAKLSEIYKKLGFNTKDANPLYAFNQFLNTFYTNINDSSTTTKELNVPLLLYYKNNEAKEATNDFVIKIKKKVKGKIVEEIYRLNSSNPKERAEFLNQLASFSNKLFTLDSDKLENLTGVGYYPVFENGEIKAVPMSYFQYIQSKLKTRLLLDESRKDDKGKLIYVQDYVLTLDDDFKVIEGVDEVIDEPIDNPVDVPVDVVNEPANVVETVLTPPKSKRTKLVPLDAESKVIFSFPNLNNNKDRIVDINNPVFVQQFIKSGIEHQVFIGNFIEASVLNDTFSDSQKLEIYNEALQAKSLEDADRLFRKICK